MLNYWENWTIKVISICMQLLRLLQWWKTWMTSLIHWLYCAMSREKRTIAADIEVESSHPLREEVTHMQVVWLTMPPITMGNTRNQVVLPPQLMNIIVDWALCNSRIMKRSNSNQQVKLRWLLWWSLAAITIPTISTMTIKTETVVAINTSSLKMMMRT